MQRLSKIIQYSVRTCNKEPFGIVNKKLLCYKQTFNNNNNNTNRRLCLSTFNNSNKKYEPFIKITSFTFAITILSWLGFTDDDEKKESELIMTLKRAILCTQREQYAAAEQMLHLALRIAQQTGNQQGITYCYDLMANLAFDQFELDKAEPLFLSVLQRLLNNGSSQDDLKVNLNS